MTKTTTKAELKKDRECFSRYVFKPDIEGTNKYLIEMKKHVLDHGIDIGSGRGRKGLQPNFQYAIHFMLKGLTPKKAAEKYTEEYKLLSD